MHLLHIVVMEGINSLAFQGKFVGQVRANMAHLQRFWINWQLIQGRINERR